MPRIIGKAPEQGHFAAVIDKSGAAVALPPGAQLHIIEDATRPDKVHRQVVIEVSLKRLVFRCMCNPRCTVVRTYTLHEQGLHTDA